MTDPRNQLDGLLFKILAIPYVLKDWWNENVLGKQPVETVFWDGDPPQKKKDK